MIKQAINYLRGAISSVVLVSTAVVVAALIMVSVGTGHSPFTALGLGDPEAEPVVVLDNDDEAVETVSPAEPMGHPVAAETSSSTRADVAAARTASRPRPRNRRNRPAVRTEMVPDRDNDGGNNQRREQPSSPARTTPTPIQPTPAPARRSPPRAVSSDGGSESSPQKPSRPAPENGSGADRSAPAPKPEPTEGRSTGPVGINEGLNRTVDGLDEALGGTLDKTGLSDTVKGVTETLVGPDTTLGKTVDGLTGGLGKLLGRR